MMIDLESVHNFFRWAEIEKDGWIEFNYLHFENGKYNRTATGFTKHPEQWESPKNSLVVVGINPRTGQGPSSAHDKDIQIYKNLYLDIEPIHAPNTNVTKEQLIDCMNFVNGITDKHLPDMGVLACSGNGYHVCVAIPPYDKPQEFGNKLQTWYKTVLLPNTEKMRQSYNVRIDSTFSPSRQVKLYGTKKPIEGARLSSFPNIHRIESAEFRDYILSFPEKPRKQVTVDFDGGQSAATLEEIEEKYGLRTNGNL